MDERPRRLEPIPTLQLGALAVLVALAAVVVAVASGSGDSGPAMPAGSPEAGAALLRAGVILVTIFEVAVLGLAVWALWPGNRRRRNQQWGAMRWLVMIISFLQAAAIIVGLWLWLHFHRRLAGGTNGLLSGIFFRPPTGLPDRAAAIAPGYNLLTAAVVAVVLLAAGAYLARLLLLDSARKTPLQLLAERVQDALEQGLQDLEAEPDPRKAVIAAYARMERSLAFAGLPRRPHETGLEYLARLLDLLLPNGAAATRLTELFQVARFSEHEVNADMKRQAIECLASVRDDLRAIADAKTQELQPA